MSALEWKNGGSRQEDTDWITRSDFPKLNTAPNRLLGRSNDVLGVGFLLGGSPLKVSRGQLCFTATAFPKLWPQKPAVNSTDSTQDISDPSLTRLLIVHKLYAHLSTFALTIPSSWNSKSILMFMLIVSSYKS